MELRRNDIMKNMESIKKGDIMKKDDIKEKLYVGFDIHKEKTRRNSNGRTRKYRTFWRIPQ